MIARSLTAINYCQVTQHFDWVGYNVVKLHQVHKCMQAQKFNMRIVYIHNYGVNLPTLVW